MTDKNRKMGLNSATPTHAIHDLRVIESACTNALAGGMTDFQSLVNPDTVLGLVRIAKASLSDEARQRLAQLIEELTYYVKLVPDEKGAAKPLDRDDLILRTRQLRSDIGI